MKALQSYKVSMDAWAKHIKESVERDLNEFNSILHNIEQQAKAGNFESREVKHMSWEYKQKLKDLGYKVKLIDGHWMEISWGHFQPKDLNK